MSNPYPPGDGGLDPERIRASLGPDSDLFRLECHPVLPSTNDRARDAANAGEAPWLVVMAEKQTAGRGRRGRTWDSPAGINLYQTITLPGPAFWEEYGHLPFVVAVAFAEGLEGLGCHLALKWPNDLLNPQGEKVGGILAETELASGQVIIGVGLNVNGQGSPTPKDGAPAPGSLRAQGMQALDRNLLAALVLRALARVWQEYRHDGFQGIRARWESRAWKLGQMVWLEEETFAVKGRLEGLDLWGRLLLDTEEGRQAFSSGSVRVHG